MKNYYLFLIVFMALIMIPNAHAHKSPEDPNRPPPKPATHASYRADCVRATQQIDQAINNVRARLLNGGEVWWDGNVGRYIVPKIDPASGLQEVSSIFAGAVWLGGFDEGGNLKMAAQTYGAGSSRTDFFPGPLTPDAGTTSADTCAQWDKFFRVYGEDIDQHILNYQASVLNGSTYDPADIPIDVKGWPARGNEFFFEIHNFELPNTIQGLAPFHDQDGDGEYTPDKGDYPIIQIRGCPDPQFPDEMIFWIYNDAGGIHSESNGDAIRMEVQVQAFGYATNDAINDMTFQRYKLINRAVESIDSTFFAMWVDPDLGCHTDDYVGSDPGRSLAYVYNQDELDGEASCTDCPGGVPTYCDRIPMLGVDYFRGPLDENAEEIGMSSFVYYNNSGLNPQPGTGDPTSAQGFYNLLSGSWEDGTPITTGGSGYNLGGTDVTKYVFPDPPNVINGWSMCAESIPMGDRRTLQASGPFRLDPSAVNELIIGAVWVPEFDYPCPNIDRLLFADDIAQALFNNCFKLTDGPTAPDANWIELDKEIIAVLTNDEQSNNYQEQYEEIDLNAPEPLPAEDRTYRFEGYKLYQLAAPNVSRGEFDDPDKARVVYQVDIKNGIAELYNWTPVENPSSNPNAPPAIWVPESKVEGANEGIRHTFTITEDQFAKGDRQLINHKKYYFSAIAYAYNEYSEFTQAVNPPEGQARTYLEGRKNIRTYTVIPRPIKYKILNANYGDGPLITRLDGVGAGGQFLDVEDEVREQMLLGETEGKITYKAGAGPLDIRIYNPLALVDGLYELTFEDENMNNDKLDNQVRWVLKDQNNQMITSQTTIDQLNEQILAEYGFTVSITQSGEPGDQLNQDNGALGGAIIYKDPTQQGWMTAIPDIDPDPFLPFDYIKTGAGQQTNALDPEQALSTINEGRFVPYSLTDYSVIQGVTSPYITPAWLNTNSSIVQVRNPLSKLNNVDIVLTPDKSKWSRCVIVETASPFYTNSNTGLGLSTEGGVDQFSPRHSPSVGKDDNDGDGLPDEDGDGMGMGWFPGYAVDIETGERLNIFFGENSTYNGLIFPEAYDQTPTAGKQIGNDMMWNPSSQVLLNTGTLPTVYSFLSGAQHFIYATRQSYDECAFIRDKLSGTDFNKINGLELITWTSLPLLASGQELLSYSEGLIPNEVLIKLRVENPYAVKEGTGLKNGYPSYQFIIDNKAPTSLTSKQEINAALAAINVVPNPYYGYSAYETSQFTNTVKITNLPPKCDVTIYSLDGKFIRQYKRNEQGLNQTGSNPGILVSQIAPDIEWNMKNHKGIPIASGAYLIHVNAPGLGERVIKWFGIARQFDPSGL